MKRFAILVLFAALLPACAPRSALETSMHASTRTTRLATFDPLNGEHPENVAMTRMAPST